MKPYLGAAALAATAVLVVPSFAFGHGSVYQSKAYTGAALALETRYFVTNHGYSYVLKETNGITELSGADAKKGMVAYNFAPSAWRSPQGGTKKTFAEVMNQAGTAAQPHATCLDAPGLESEAAIKSWQGDPFYNYVPFQDTSAGLEDDPAKWMATLAGAGVTAADLATVEARVNKCTQLGGVYVPADEIATQASALAEGLTKPIEERLLGANTSNTTLTSQVTALTNEVNTLKAQVSGMQAAATPIKLTVASAKAKTVASKGATVTVDAQAQRAYTVTVSLTEAQARKLKLSSSVLGKTSVMTDAAGKATAAVKVSKAAAKALKALKKSVSVNVEAISGDRFATAKSKFTR
jgi:hypothetical protein